MGLGSWLLSTEKLSESLSKQTFFLNLVLQVSSFSSLYILETIPPENVKLHESTAQLGPVALHSVSRCAGLIFFFKSHFSSAHNLVGAPRHRAFKDLHCRGGQHLMS